MKRAIVSFLSVILTTLHLGAEDQPEDEGLIAPLTETDASQQGQAQRQDFMKILKTEVEPNLPSSDVQKLNRSVQRLGSYRDEWASQAESFLVANAPVAELYLYRYAMLNNPRLNSRILKTLRQFPSYRFPRAALAFADFFSAEKAEFLPVLAAALRQDPTMAFESFQFVMNNWGSDLNLHEKLYFLSQTCAAWKKAGPPLPDMINAVLGQATEFWDLVFAEEVRSCLKGY